MRVSRRESQDELAPSIYAERAYGLALTANSDRTWSLFRDDQNLWQISVVESPIAHGEWEAYSPYGYSGIFADQSLTPDQVAQHWQETLHALQGAGIVSLFLRFPPFAYPGQGVAAFLGLDRLELELVSKTIEVATSVPEEVWAGMSGRARTAVRKATRVGMSVDVSPASELNLGSASPFRRLYDETMKRVGASKQHIYDDSYYCTLLAHLKDRIHVVNVSTYDGRPAASAMIMLDGPIVHYHLSGSEPRAARDGANNLLLWTILEWSARNSFQFVHLGGGLSAGDSLFRFKESFGGQPRDFWVGRAIVNEKRYAELESMRAASLDTTVSQLKLSGFFPTFRAVPKS